MSMLLRRHRRGGVKSPAIAEEPKAFPETKVKETNNDNKRKNNNGKNISK